MWHIDMFLKEYGFLVKLAGWRNEARAGKWGVRPAAPLLAISARRTHTRTEVDKRQGARAGRCDRTRGSSSRPAFPQPSPCLTPCTGHLLLSSRLVPPTASLICPPLLPPPLSFPSVRDRATVWRTPATIPIPVSLFPQGPASLLPQTPSLFLHALLEVRLLSLYYSGHQRLLMQLCLLREGVSSKCMTGLSKERYPQPGTCLLSNTGCDSRVLVLHKRNPA